MEKVYKFLLLFLLCLSTTVFASSNLPKTDPKTDQNNLQNTGQNTLKNTGQKPGPKNDQETNQETYKATDRNTIVDSKKPETKNHGPKNHSPNKHSPNKHNSRTGGSNFAEKQSVNSKSQSFTGFNLGANLGFGSLSIKVYQMGPSINIYNVGGFLGYDYEFKSGLLTGIQAGLDRAFRSGNSGSFEFNLRPRIGYAFNETFAAGLTPGLKVWFENKTSLSFFMPGLFLEGKFGKFKVGFQYDFAIRKESILSVTRNTYSLYIAYKF